MGDAWNDLPMLDEVEIGFLLGSAVAPDLVPSGVERIDREGPDGFSVAARQLLSIWG